MNIIWEFILAGGGGGVELKNTSNLGVIFETKFCFDSKLLLGFNFPSLIMPLRTKIFSKPCMIHILENIFEN